MARAARFRGPVAGVALVIASVPAFAWGEEPAVFPPVPEAPPTSAAPEVAPPSTSTAAPSASAGGAFYYGTPPPAPTGQEATTRRRSTPLMVTGIVLAGIGAVSALYGIATLVDEGNPCLPLQSAQDCRDQSPRAVGIVLTVTAGALVATGVPLILVGGTRIPREPPPGVSAELLVAPNGGALRVHF